MSNGGYIPGVVSHSPKPQTASQQKPFYFGGGSWVPSLLGNKSQMIGEGLTEQIKKEVKHKRKK